MEEIDIIELLKREKEGKAPKKIEINGTSYALVPNYKVRGIQYWYSNEINMFYEYWFDNKNISADTKIKILDKPILEELSDDDMLQRKKVKEKINEIVRCLNKGNKDER